MSFSKSQLRQNGIAGLLLVVSVVVGIAIIATVFIILHSHSGTPKAKVAIPSNTCVSKQLTSGSTGNCVSDAQTMVNFMETSKLTQCPFTGGSTIAVTGNYDSATAAQVKVVQAWFNCYNKEEGGSANIAENGEMGPDTWLPLCSYAYKFPKQAGSSPSPYYQQTLSAGADAGCGSLT